MISSNKGMVRAVAAVLLVTVISQVFYFTVVHPLDSEVLRAVTWLTELLVFSLVAAVGVSLAARDRRSSIAWALVSLYGVVNVIQVGMGLSMFAPAREATDNAPQLFDTILAGAFFLYFHAKFVLGIAGAHFGLLASREGAGTAKALGGFAVLSSVVAAGLNFLAMVDSENWLFAAGASGTLAAAVLGVLFLMYDPTEATAKA